MIKELNRGLLQKVYPQICPKRRIWDPILQRLIRTADLIWGQHRKNPEVGFINSPEIQKGFQVRQ